MARKKPLTYSQVMRERPEPVTARPEPVTARPALFEPLIDELAKRVADAVEGRLVEYLSERRNEPGPRLLDRRGMGLALGVCAETVDKLRRQGLPTVMVGDSPRFLLADCLAWLKARPAK